MIYKNGVPIGYFEGLSLFDRMESGFNLYYTFRDGETAWLYAQVLRVMRQITGVTAFSLDPYQIGFENEEGIQSGAFWFYRKLGFRSTSQELRTLTEREEEKISTRQKYRTSATTLRRLAQAPMIFELDQSTRGDWDRFQIRNIGFALQKLMSNRFNGDVRQLHASAMENLFNKCGIRNESADDLAMALLLVPDLQHWDTVEKDLLEKIIQAKQAGSEATYLRLLQKHERLRRAFLTLGSN
jgi:hypothetical protein